MNFMDRRAFQEEFPYNLKLCQQFAHLAKSFEAWRPIRGDGSLDCRAEDMAVCQGIAITAP